MAAWRGACHQRRRPARVRRQGRMFHESAVGLAGVCGAVGNSGNRYRYKHKVMDRVEYTLP